MYDTSSPWFLPLKFIHVVGAMALLGSLLCYVVLKLHADRSGDPGHAARTHQGLRRADGVLVAPAAVAVFAGGYSIIRFLGDKIADHWFAIWGLILLFTSLGFWYFGVRRLNLRLAEEADACAAHKQPLSARYGAMSVAWLSSAGFAILALVVAAFIMIFRARLGIA